MRQLAAFAGVMFCSAMFAQTTVPRENIPTGVSPEIREEIERLYLKTTDVVQAAEKLGAMGARAAPAIPFLMGLFKGGDSLECVQEGRTQFCGFGLEKGAAGAALAMIGAPALPPLLETLKTGDEDAASGAIAALARMKDPRASAALIQFAKDARYVHRKAIPSELGRSEDPQAGDLLLALAKDSDPEMRSSAMRGLADSKDRRAADALIAGLADSDDSVRTSAGFALRDLKEPRAFDALVKALADSNGTVRNSACQALGELKDTRAVEALIAVVSRDPEELVRFQAGRALEAITGQAFGESGTQWQSWFNQQKR